MTDKATAEAKEEAPAEAEGKLHAPQWSRVGEGKTGAATGGAIDVSKRGPMKMAEKYYSEQYVDIYCGHVLDVLRSFPDECVQMAITSPPYWGLRSYAGGTDIVWGGDPGCEHQWIKSERYLHRGSTKSSKLTDGVMTQSQTKDNFCSLCGAWRGQLGLEPTPEFYVEHLMEIFREVKRVLRKDGSFYLNIGDTYAAGGGTQVLQTKNASHGLAGYRHKTPMISPKCMVCIPERVMFAMVDDGWILRNKIIWHKPNPMPSSVKDRFTTTWEFLLFFCKARERRGWEHVRAYDMTETERAWLAAMIDAEGCISIAKEQNNRAFQLAVEVANKKVAIADRCKSITGLGSITHLASGMHHYHFGGKMAEIILRQVYPYLVIKKEQAKVGLHLQSLNKLRGAPKGQQGGTRPLTEDEVKERQSLQQLCQDLNQGRIESSDLPEPDLILPNRYIGCEKYYFDLDSVRLPHATQSLERYQRGVNLGRPAEGKSGEVGPMQQYTRAPQWFRDTVLPDSDYKGKFDNPDWREEAAKKGQLFDQPVAHQGGGNTGLIGKHHGSSHDGRAGFDRRKSQQPVDKGGHELPPTVGDEAFNPKGKNPTDYWEIATQPSKVKHYAAFPEKLCERPILASSRVGDIVLDPLAGTGTVAVVAKKLGRRAIMIDCTEEYCSIMKERIRKVEYQPELGVE